MSFLDYINNAVIKFPIYFTSNMCMCIVRLTWCIEEFKCLFCFFKYSYFSEKILKITIIKTFDFCKSLSSSDPSYQTRFKMLRQQNQNKLSPSGEAIPLTRLLFHFSWDGLIKMGYNCIIMYNSQYTYCWSVYLPPKLTTLPNLEAGTLLSFALSLNCKTKMC